MFFRVILLLIFIGGAGCSPNIPFLNINLDQITNPKETNTVLAPKETTAAPQETLASKTIKISETKPDKKVRIDPRLKKILSTPSLLAKKQSIIAAQKAVSIVKSQSETQVVASSNLGPSLDDDTLELDATTGLTMSKMISDGGALIALTDAANLNVIASKLIYNQSINKQLIEIIKSEQTIINFRKVKAIYDEQLKVYSENLPLIESAVKANVVSKTDALKLEQLKLKSEEAFLTAKTASEASQIIRDKYKLDDRDEFFELNTTNWKSFDKKSSKITLPNIELIETQIKILEKDINAIQASFKANVSFAGNATANVSDLNNSVGFVGLNISLPLKDGGKKNFEIEEKELQLVGLQQQKDEAVLLNITSFKALSNFDKIYTTRSNLLEMQIENSQVISEDMELKLRAGAASVIDLATEKMNLFDLRSQKVSLEFQKINEIIKFYGTIGLECDLAELCDQISYSAELD